MVSPVTELCRMVELVLLFFKKTSDMTPRIAQDLNIIMKKCSHEVEVIWMYITKM